MRPVKKLPNTCLSVAEELTGSKFGFIGEVNPAGRFDTIAISNPGWDACKMPDSEATLLTKDMEIRGIDRSVIREGKSRIVNDPASHPDRVGTPEGHPPITSFLGVPLKISDKTIGMIGLANKESGYNTADQKAIEDLSIALLEALNRKRTEEALRKSEEQYRHLVESTSDWVWECDVEGRHTFANEALKTILGYEIQEIIGTLATRLMHPEDRERNRKIFKRSVVEKKGWQSSVARWQHKDGTVRFLESTAKPVLDPQGGLVGFTGVDRDITKRMLAEGERDRLFDELRSLNLRLEEKIKERTSELEMAVREADEANRAKSAFLSSMSHELRTPLNSIIGFSEVLSDQHFGELNEKQAEYVIDVLESGKHLLSLINDILDLSKVEAAKMELDLSQVNIKNLLENSLIMIKETAMKRGISLDLRIPEYLSELEIRADERKLKQVMYNFLSNAAKFTPEGGAITAETKQEGNKLIISVSDTGIGLSPKNQKMIFEEFYQVSGGISDKTPGTGLGLPLSKALVEMHGGKIWVESEGEGKGSRFSFALNIEAEHLEEGKIETISIERDHKKMMKHILKEAKKDMKK